jgi:two-component system NtrC family response regulator
LSQKNNQLQTLLIVEDDEGLQSQLRWCFKDYNVVVAGDRLTALSNIRRHEPSVVTLDLGLPPDHSNVSEGFALLEEIVSLTPETKVIVITGNDDRKNAVRAIAKGAYDFYQKPVDPDILRIIVDRGFQLYDLEQENRELIKTRNESPLQSMVTASPEMFEVCRISEKVAPTDATLLLQGESGTGKEVLARAIHELSPRCNKPFVAINCAAIPETLLESELFGYEKGAFTGAIKQTIGKIESANGGTLFLDEIGDLPMALQAKLLRFLQERVIERLGGHKEIPVDVRVICATHCDLDEMISAGSFRDDLYYRLSEIKIQLPPLRDRSGDAVLLARTFLEQYSAQTVTRVSGFTKDALSAIENYSWPGNIRELQNKVKRAVIMSETSLISPIELELDISKVKKLPLNLREVREHAERETISRAINYTDGNISDAAGLLGVSRPTLYDLIKKYKLK